MTLRHITAAEMRHQQKKREREIGTFLFAMMGFDSATSSFLALLVKIIKKKLKKAYLKTKVFNFGFCWPVMVVKLRKGQKILLKFKIIIS